jgi:hypothetical protein
MQQRLFGQFALVPVVRTDAGEVHVGTDRHYCTGSQAGSSILLRCQQEEAGDKRECHDDQQCWQDAPNPARIEVQKRETTAVQVFQQQAGDQIA